MKKIAFILLCAIPMFTACSKAKPVTSSELETKAQSEGFKIEKSEGVYKLTKQNCTVEFGFYNSQGEAEDAYFNFAEPIGSSFGVSRSMWGFKAKANPGQSYKVSATETKHHFKLSNRSTFVYCTQIENTAFLFNGTPECEKAVGHLADAIDY